ncbi:MAG TPA: prolipoprotein diacylglyceryl transferase [Candidatus Ruthenibacterium merdavium]|uniref:Phosphatidylglycerol--prolipoprotein diacylglyceryl transferase n=1 Tax=Candidatus Ruthenibacterium merdavium TaxID=2838752 RepID=A0A9D2Q3W7_9FIRM|nr:prolipoprotein diacylglyceryl transferase [Candidatus Ruthenibacterium merdavium]
MVNHVSFPGLELEMEINRVAFTVFGVPIYWYGVCIALGLLLGMLYAFRYAKSYGIDADRMVDVIFASTIAAIIGGRAYYVATAPFEYQSIWEMIDIRLGGIAIYGGIIAAFAMGALMCRVRKVPMLPMFDLAAQGFLIGQCLGRWGNFFNQEAFGGNTTLPWGMISESTQQYLQAVQETLAAQGMTVDPSMPVHPTFLYESIWCGLGFLLLWRYSKHRRFHGEMTLLYIMWYGFERFFVEGLRTDSLMVGNVRISQAVAALSVAAALVLWVILRRKYRGVPLVIPALPGEENASKPTQIDEPGESTKEAVQKEKPQDDESEKDDDRDDEQEQGKAQKSSEPSSDEGQDDDSEKEQEQTPDKQESAKESDEEKKTDQK